MSADSQFGASGMMSPGWAGTDADSLVGDHAWITAALRFEAALARCQARLGIIPESAAETIETVARSLSVDAREMEHGVYATSNPAIPLIQGLQRAVDGRSPGTSDYVHLGATSQDAADSASMLVCTRALTDLRDTLGHIRQRIAQLIEEHGDSPMVGRTLSQHAVPITFGAKAATWLNLVADAEGEVRELVDAGLPLALGGASGTLAAYGEYARQATGASFDPFRLVDAVAAELGLASHYQPWHTARTPIARIAGALAIVTGALGKIAADIHVMCRTEVGEVGEGLPEGGGISSSMPQKQNPVKTVLVSAAARQMPAHTLVLFQSMISEDERPAGAWQAEWQPLSDAFRLALGSSSHMRELVRDLRVDTARMRGNLVIGGASVLSERLNVHLAPLVGRLKAKELLTELVSEGPPDPAELAPRLRAALAEHGADTAALDVEGLLTVEDYVGASAEIARRALQRSTGAGQGWTTP